MNIPVELIAVFLTAMLGLQGWTLAEIISLKVKMARYEALEKRVEQLESKII